ncbi:MAG: hypothetical protein ACLTKG_05510 [Collinsella intestinalis]
MPVAARWRLLGRAPLSLPRHRRLKDGGSLAGSILNMKMPSRTLMGHRHEGRGRHGHQVPAEANDIADECGSIRPGRNADFVVLNPDLTLVETYLGGESVYKA